MKNFYTIGEFARLINVTEQTLRNWDESGKLVAHRTLGGGHRRYTPDQLAQFIDLPSEGDQRVLMYMRVKKDNITDEVLDEISQLRLYLTAKYGDKSDMYVDIDDGVSIESLPEFQKLLDLLESDGVKKLYLHAIYDSDELVFKALKAVLTVKGLEVELK